MRGAIEGFEVGVHLIETWTARRSVTPSSSLQATLTGVSVSRCPPRAPQALSRSLDTCSWLAGSRLRRRIRSMSITVPPRRTSGNDTHLWAGAFGSRALRSSKATSLRPAWAPATVAASSRRSSSVMGLTWNFRQTGKPTSGAATPGVVSSEFILLGRWSVDQAASPGILSGYQQNTPCGRLPRIPWLSTSKSRSAVPAAVWNCFVAACAGPVTGGSAGPAPASAAGARKSSSATIIVAESAGRANHWWSITDGGAMSRRP